MVMDDSTTDEFLCVDLPRYKCRTETKTLYEKSCKTHFTFSCHFPSDGSGYGNGMLNHLYPEQRYKYSPSIPSDWNLNEKFAAGAYGGEPVYGWQKFCKKTPNEDCQKVPRERHYEVCEQISQRECEKATNKNPKPVEKQVCKDVFRQKCEVKTQRAPRKVDLPRYIKDCKPVEKELCGSVGKTELQTKCSTDVRPVCKFYPTEEKCVKVPRKHCVQVPYQVKTTDCNEAYTSNTGDAVPIGGFQGYGESGGSYGGSGGYERGLRRRERYRFFGKK